MNSLRQQAEAWIDNNPHIYALFVRFAKEKLAAGKRFGIGQLTERVRWETDLDWEGEYKIPNNHRAYIARKLLDDYPELGALLRTHRTQDEVMA